MTLLQPSRYSSQMLSVLRIVTGLIFMSAGSMKLFGYPASPTPMPPVEFLSQMWVAGVLEVYGGLAIVLGLLTRPVAFILSGEMAVAYFQAHFPQSPFPTVNNGVGAVLFCFLFLYMTFAGGGAWGVDALIARHRVARPSTPVETHDDHLTTEAPWHTRDRAARVHARH